MSGQETIAMVMNAKKFSDATDSNYYITNIEEKYVTYEQIYSTSQERNWVEVFVIRSQGILGRIEYKSQIKSA